MREYNLAGGSGAGKSYRARKLCNKYRINGIFDNDIFIVKERIPADSSAKRQHEKISGALTITRLS